MERTLPATWRLPALEWRRALNAASLLIVAGFWLIVASHPMVNDAHTYWYSTQPGVELYGRQWNVEADAYVYSPVFAIALKTLTWLPFATFHVIWTGVLTLTLIWLVGPIWAVVALLIPGFAGYEIVLGNVNLLIAAAVVLGLSGRSATWAFPLFTKVTPAVGMLWHLARREWSALASVTGVSVVLGLASLVLLPQAWPAWIGVLQTQGPPLPDALLVIPIIVRLPLAAALVLLAAYRDWRWLVAVAVWLAIPNWSVLPSLTVLLAIPRLLQVGPAGYST